MAVRKELNASGQEEDSESRRIVQVAHGLASSITPQQKGLGTVTISEWKVHTGCKVDLPLQRPCFEYRGAGRIASSAKKLCCFHLGLGNY
jgi:hypothetical protein